MLKVLHGGGRLHCSSALYKQCLPMTFCSRISLVLLSGLLLLAGSLSAESPVDTTDQSVETSQRDSRMGWWREAKFGMFVHWGVYSVVGGQYKGQDLPNSAEWMMCRGRVPIAEYEKYAAQFNPSKFDADEFVGRAKRAGMKYLVITAKHHDGFSMFGSKASDYNVVDATPFGRDIMKELADACGRQGIRFGFYYSQCQDWHHPGGMGNSWDKSIERVSFDEYVSEKAAPEVQQLLTEYGPISIFWWDTPRKMSQESFDALHSSTKLQTGVITNDRLGKDHPGDHKTFERNIPAQGPNDQDWEVCMPISGSWGYKIGDNSFKSSTTLIRNLIDIASKGGNYLLNVSPTGEGTLLPPAIERLEEIGKWMDVHSESIYGTSASPLGKLDWGRCTMKPEGDSTLLYLHVFDWPTDGKLLVPGLNSGIHSAALLGGSDSIATESSDHGTVVTLPADPTNPYASVVVLEIDGKLDVRETLPSPSADGSLLLSASDAYIHNNEGSKQADVRMHDDIPHVGYWTDNRAWIEWDVNIDQLGQYEVFVTGSVEGEKTGLSIGPSGNIVSGEFASTGSYGKYVETSVGLIDFKEAGQSRIQVKPDPDNWQPMNLREVRLQRVTPNRN